MPTGISKIDCSGQHIVDASTGNPILDATNLRDLGSIYPQWKAGLTTTVSYKKPDRFRFVRCLVWRQSLLADQFDPLSHG